VANFLGETNFVAAVVSGTIDGAVTLETAAGELRSTAGMHSTPKGGNVTCSLRPEALKRAAAGNASNLLSGKSLQSIYLGEMAQHLLELPDGTILKSFELNPGPFPSPGEAMTLTIDPAEVVILPD
jgi:ABC-type Fe3+/spermidine/putrescine transport system ATPase subunit